MDGPEVIKAALSEDESRPCSHSNRSTLATGTCSSVSHASRDSSKAWGRSSLLFGVKQPNFHLWDRWGTQGAEYPMLQLQWHQEDATAK